MSFKKVESIRGSSTLFEHCEAIVNFENMLNKRLKGSIVKRKYYKFYKATYECENF